MPRKINNSAKLPAPKKVWTQEEREDLKNLLRRGEETYKKILVLIDKLQTKAVLEKINSIKED